MNSWIDCGRCHIFSHHSVSAVWLYVKMNMLRCKKIIFTYICAWCRANQNNRIPIFTRPPKFQTLPLSICLHVLCQFRHKNLSITSPSNPPEDGPGIQSYSPECLSNFPLPTFGFQGIQKKKKKKGAGNDHLHLCQPVKSNPHRQNERCQALTWRAILRAHANVCQELISAPVLQQRHGVPSCFYSLPLMRGGDVAPFSSHSPQNRPPRLVSFLAAASLPCHDTLSEKLRKVAICPGISNPNFKYKRDMIPLNLDQIPLSLQTSVTHCWRVWTLI